MAAIRMTGVRRRPGRLLSGASALALLIVVGCSSLPRPPQVDAAAAKFSGERVLAHLDALEGLAPRLPGSRNDQMARRYLEREFRASGAESTVFPAQAQAQDRSNAELPGASRDILLLVAPYPALDSGAGREGVGDLGAAVLLEVARVFGTAQPSYELRFVLAETRPRLSLGESASGKSRWEGVPTARAARERVTEAGRVLAEKIEAEGELDRIRAILVLDLADRSSPRFKRDLGSHPGFRALFWKSASRLGGEANFPPDADWEASESLHVGFRERSMNRVVALVDESFAIGGADIRRAGQRADLDQAVSADSLSSLGRIVVDALGHLMRRLEKVDAF